MKVNDKHDIKIPSVSEFEKFLQKLTGFAESEKVFTYNNQDYVKFLKRKIWDDYDFTIDELIRGEEMYNPDRQAPDAYVSLKRKINEHLDNTDFLIMQLAEDCDQRLDDLVLHTEEKIASNTLTGPDYLGIKRSSNVIRVILLTIASKIDRIEAEENVSHPLKPITKANLRKILDVTTQVEAHLETMLESVDKENLKAEPKAWLAAAVVLVFALLYIFSFLALDKNKSAIEQILYFFGLR